MHHASTTSGKGPDEQPTQVSKPGKGGGDAAVEALSGAAGSIIALLATYPLKTIYTLQALNAGSSSHQRSILQVIRKYRLQGLYVGIGPNVVETALSSSVYFYLYSRLRHFVVMHAKRAPSTAPLQGTGHHEHSTKHTDIGVLSSLLVAALAGVGNQLLTMPAAVVTTRMQAQSKLMQEGKLPRTARVGWRAVASDILRESGVWGFWVGLLPSLVLVSNPAIQYMLVEQLQRLLRSFKSTMSKAKLSAQGPPPQQQQQQHQIQQQQEQVQAAARQKQQEEQLECLECMGDQSPEMRRLQEAWRQLQELHRQQQQLEQQVQQTQAQTQTQLAQQQQQQQATNSCSCNHGNAVREHTAAAGPQGMAHSNGQPPAGNTPAIQLHPLEVFSTSALAKVGATVATYWLVVVKSRLQAGKGTSADMQYKGTLHALSTIWRIEGFGGFFRGLRAKLLQTALNAALMLMLKEQVYNATKRFLSSKAVAEGLSRLGASSRQSHQLIGR